MSEYETWEDEEFEDLIIEVSDLDDPEALLKGLKEFRDMADPITQVANDCMLVRLQFREPSGKRIRDPEIYPRVVELEGGPEIVEQIVASLCREDDAFELYYDEENTALQYAVGALCKKDTKYLFLAGHYLNLIEAQNPGTGEMIEELLEYWKAQRQGDFATAVVTGLGYCAEEFYDFTQDVMDEDSSIGAYLKDDSNLKRVVSEWKCATQFCEDILDQILEPLREEAEAFATRVESFADVDPARGPMPWRNNVTCNSFVTTKPPA